MARPRQTHCFRGHPLDEAHITQTAKGTKRNCRKCKYIRFKYYHGIEDKPKGKR